MPTITPLLTYFDSLLSDVNTPDAETALTAWINQHPNPCEWGGTKHEHLQLAHIFMRKNKNGKNIFQLFCQNTQQYQLHKSIMHKLLLFCDKNKSFSIFQVLIISMLDADRNAENKEPLFFTMHWEVFDAINTFYFNCRWSSVLSESMNRDFRVCILAALIFHDRENFQDQLQFHLETSPTIQQDLALIFYMHAKLEACFQKIFEKLLKIKNTNPPLRAALWAAIQKF